MERDRHGRSLKQQTAWTPGHNFSLAAAAGYCFSSSSWPAALSPPPSSSYTCGYCRREFRSAQALGGHMNVHRRDRARLRQCFPPPNPSNLQMRTAAPCRAAPPIPNLNFLPPEPEPPAVYSFFSTTTAMSAAETMKYASAAAVEVNLDLGIGGVCSHDGTAAAEDDGELDLELRLGCSWE